MGSTRHVAAWCAGAVVAALGLQLLTTPVHANESSTLSIPSETPKASAQDAPTTQPESLRNSREAVLEGSEGLELPAWAVDAKGAATVVGVTYLGGGSEKCNRWDPNPSTWVVQAWRSESPSSQWSTSPTTVASGSCKEAPPPYLTLHTHESGAVALVIEPRSSVESGRTTWLSVHFWDPQEKAWGAPIVVPSMPGWESYPSRHWGVLTDDTFYLAGSLGATTGVAALSGGAVVSRASNTGVADPQSGYVPAIAGIGADPQGRLVLYRSQANPDNPAYCYNSRAACLQMTRTVWSAAEKTLGSGTTIARTVMSEYGQTMQVDDQGNAVWEDYRVDGAVGSTLHTFIGGKYRRVDDIPVYWGVNQAAGWAFRGDQLFALEVSEPPGFTPAAQSVRRHRLDVTSGKSVEKRVIGSLVRSMNGCTSDDVIDNWVDRMGTPMTVWSAGKPDCASNRYDVKLQSGDDKAEVVGKCLGPNCEIIMGSGGQGLIINRITALDSGLQRLQVTRFGVASSCVVVPRDGGVLPSGVGDVSAGVGAASVGGVAAASSARKRFGPVEIAGCLFQDKQGRWVHQGDAVRMNGIDIEADPGTVRFDPRRKEVAFVPCDRQGPVMCAGSGRSRGYAIKAGTYSVYSWSMTGDSMVRVPWRSTDTEVRFDPIAYVRTVTRGVVRPPRQLGPAGLEVADRLGLSLTLTYDQMERQGKATLEFAVEVPLPVGVRAVPAKVRVPEKLAEAEKAVSVPEVRGVEQAPAPPPPAPSAPARVPNGECSPAEDGAVIVINGAQYVCGIGMDRADQRHRWRAKTPANTPGRPPVVGQFCNASKDVGRTPVSTGRGALECARSARPNKGGQYEYRWRSVRLPAAVREGQACKVGDVGRSYPARKPVVRRSGAPEAGQLVCMQVSSAGKVRNELVWQTRSGVFVSLTFQTTTEKGLLPVTVAAVLKRLDVGPVALADVSLRLRPPSDTTPAELGFTGTIEAKLPVPGVKPGRSLGSVSAEIAWADTDLSKFRLAATGTLPLGSVTILGAEFEAVRDDSATPWQLSVGGSIGFGPAIPSNIAAGDREWKYLFEGTGRLIYRSEPKDLTRRIIFTGQGTWWGMPVGSLRLEMHAAESNPWKPTRYEIEALLGIDPGQWIGLPGIVTAQGKLYGWYDPTKELFQIHGYTGLRVPLAATDLTGNLMISSRGQALCYSTGGEFAGWVYLYKDGKTQDFDTGCDVGKAAIA